MPGSGACPRQARGDGARPHGLPTGGTVDGVRGDNVLLAPPFIVDVARRGHHRRAPWRGHRRRDWDDELSRFGPPTIKARAASVPRERRRRWCDRRGRLVAEGDPQESCVAKPGAAALDPLAAVARRPGRAVDRRTAVALAFIVAIRRPFLGVAQHVVQAKCIGREFPRRSSLGIAVEAKEALPGRGARHGMLAGLIEAIAVSADRRVTVTEAITWPRSGRGSPARGIFPLGLAEQVIALARFLREPIHVGLASGQLRHTADMIRPWA